MTSKIDFGVGGFDSSYCTFVLMCPTGCSVLYCDAADKTSFESYETAIRGVSAARILVQDG